MLRFLLVLFLLAMLVYTGFLHHHRAQNSEWMLFSASDYENVEPDPYRWPTNYTVNPDIYAMNMQTGQYRNLNLPHNAIVRFMSDNQTLYFTANGDEPAFQSRVGNRYWEGYERDIYRVDPTDIANVQNLTQTPYEDDYLTIISPDGEWLYYSTDSGYGTYEEIIAGISWENNEWWNASKIRTDGSAREKLTDAPKHLNWVTGYISSTDTLVMGTYSMFFNSACIGSLHFAEIDGTFIEYVDFKHQRWTEVAYIPPSEDWIYYKYTDDVEYIKRGAWHIGRIKPDGTDQQILTSTPVNMGNVVGIDAREEWLYFYSDLHRVFPYLPYYEQAKIISRVALGGNAPRTETIVENATLWDITPDKKWLFFSIEDDIYRLNLQSGLWTYLISLPDENYFLSYSLDEQWLYFWSVIEDAESDYATETYIYRMRFDGSGLERISTTRALNPCMNPHACHENLVMIKDFGMKWHPQTHIYLSGFVLMVWLIIEGVRRRSRTPSEYNYSMA